MELNHEGHISKFAPEDVISNVPDIVITNVLDRLPLKDAVRTSVLSSNWRCKWTVLSQVVFDESFFNSVSKVKGNVSLVISRILLHLKGPVTKFVLNMEDAYVDEVLDDEDINHWILFLSRNGIKDLTLKFKEETAVKLPTHVFSCLELKHLKLCHCSFRPPPSFHGFPNLLTLKLLTGFEDCSEVVKLFSRSPLLEILKLNDYYGEGKVKLAEIAKLENLKILSLSLCDLDNPEMTSSSTIFELLDSLPKLKELDLDFIGWKFIEDVAKKRLSTASPCLKALKLSSIWLDDGLELSCAFELIRSFPNLQTLKIKAGVKNGEPSPRVEYSTVGPFQLRRVVCEDLRGSENEVCLIKCLLACSPLLKSIVIRVSQFLSSDEKLIFAMKLLKLRRASPLAEIDLFNF